MAKRILITGATGYLGQSINVNLAANHDTIPTYCENQVVKNAIRYRFPEDDLYALVTEHQIDIIIFAAEIEKNQDHYNGAALKDPEFLGAQLKKQIENLPDKRFVYISSDGIFDGQKGLYTESDVPRPVTPYGRNLKACEEIVQISCPNHLIIRPSYLFGYSLGRLDTRLQKTQMLCRNGQTPAYFNNMFKSPIHVYHAANLIAQLALSNFVGIVHIGGPRLSVFDFHQQGMSALGNPAHIQPVSMPVDAGLLPDTSLDVTLCKQLTGFTPKSIHESFAECALLQKEN
jgi:dTDP-4-dehydrorhamnose reductase